MKHTISVVISAYNEEKTIGRCLTSVSFADEIIVIDNTSLDDTAKIAKKFTPKVFSQPNRLMLNTNKNFGFTKATSEWILNLDADEEVPQSLAREIKQVIQSNQEENGYWIKRKNYSFGKWIAHGLWWPDKQIRLFRKGKGAFPCQHIHEYVKVEGRVGELTEPYLHYNYESIHQYLTKIDRASSSEALVLKESNYRIAWYDAMRFPVSDFLKIYFAQRGYRDGLHGLVLALFQMFYSFCVYAKIWEMYGFPERDVAPSAVSREFTGRKSEFIYWIYTMTMQETNDPVKRGILRILRKFSRFRS